MTDPSLPEDHRAESAAERWSGTGSEVGPGAEPGMGSDDDPGTEAGMGSEVDPGAEPGMGSDDDPGTEADGSGGTPDRAGNSVRVRVPRRVLLVSWVDRLLGSVDRLLGS